MMLMEKGEVSDTRGAAKSPGPFSDTALWIGVLNTKSEVNLIFCTITSIYTFLNYLTLIKKYNAVVAPLQSILRSFMILKLIKHWTVYFLSVGVTSPLWPSILNLKEEGL